MNALAVTAVNPPLRVRWASGGMEAAKWIALGLMVLDHVNAAFFARELGTWATALGRVAFPLFLLVFGYNLARPGARKGRTLGLLLAFGAVAQVPFAWLYTAHWWQLNILFLFAAVTGAVMLMERGRVLEACTVGLVAGFVVEYAWAGLSPVLAAYGAFKHGGAWRWFVVLATFGLLCHWNGNAWALLGLPLAYVLAQWEAPVPRSRWAFWVAYPLHLVAIAAIASL